MMNAKRWCAMAGMAVAVSLSAGNLLAQDNNQGGGRQRGGGPGGGPGGRGNFDPAQFQQRIMEGFKERLEITDEAEWKVVQPLLQKVMDTQRQMMSDRMRGAFRGPRGGGPGGEGDQNRGRGFGGFGGTPSPEAEGLQKAIEAKASNAELKAALAKYVEARKAKQADLEKAQADLRKVLSVRQEAILTESGML